LNVASSTSIIVSEIYRRLNSTQKWILKKTPCFS
jgi:hypothetical protein